jgi:hypothetical protein
MQLKAIAALILAVSTLSVCRVQASTLILPPTIEEAFGAPAILLNDTTTLTFTITNPAANGSTELVGLAFTDDIPTGITPSFTSVSTVCGGTGSISAATGVVGLAGASVASTCLFSLTVIGTILGHFIDTTGLVSSTNGGTGNSATASIDGVPSITPLPAALSLFATGLGAIVLLLWLRPRMVGRHLMETGTTIQTDFFHQILPPTALILGLVLTIVWISFLAYQIGRLFEATL